MPRAQVTFVRRHSSASSFHCRFRTQVCDDRVIPCVAILVAKNNEMVWHRLIGIGRLQPITQLSRFAESGLGEMDVITSVRLPAPAGAALFSEDFAVPCA